MALSDVIRAVAVTVGAGPTLLNPIAFAAAPLIARQMGLTTFAVLATVVLLVTCYAVLLVRGADALTSPMSGAGQPGTELSVS